MNIDSAVLLGVLCDPFPSLCTFSRYGRRKGVPQSKTLAYFDFQIF